MTQEYHILSKTLCAPMSSMTDHYRDGVINGIDLDGFYMKWMIQGTNVPSWLKIKH